MIQELTELHENPLSYFVLGTEQGLYELFLYSKYLSNQIKVNVFDFDKKYFDDILDLLSYGSGNVSVSCVIFNLINDISLRKEVDLSKFTKRLNEVYFDKIYCYRGDFIRMGPKKIISKLNLKFAVSNWQASISEILQIKIRKNLKEIKYLIQNLKNKL